MTQKDKHLLTELGLTLALLITSVFLLKPDPFWSFQLILIGGSLAGFAFGWYNRAKPLEGIKYLTDAAILITVTWLGYRIFKSSFLYKEVIAVLIQSVIILEIIFTFNFSAPGKTAYIRILSLLVFMASSVFAAAYSIPLAIVYLLVWLAIYRFQFAGFLPTMSLKGSRRYYSLITSLACFLIAMLLAWFISSNIYLGRIKQGMLFLDEDLQDMGAGSGGKESSQAEKFYSLQDDLQSKLTDLALKLDSYEKRRQLIYLFSELVKDSIKTMEMDKAEIGLIDILKRQGAGLEGAAQAITFTKGYLDQKNSLNLQKNKEDIVEKLRNLRLNIFDKIKIISLANKIQQTNSYQKLQEHSRDIQSAIGKASLNKEIQQDLKQSARNLSNLKAFEFYRRKMRALEQRTPALGEEIEKQVEDVVSGIKHTQVPDDVKETVKRISQLKNDTQISDGKAGRDLLKSLEEVLRIKLDLLAAEKSEELRDEAAKEQKPGAQADKFNQKMDDVGRAKDYQEFVEGFLGLSQQSKDNHLGLGEALGELLDLKSESFKQEAKNKIENLLPQDLPRQIKKEVLNALEEMEEKENFRDLQRKLEELISKIKDLENKEDLSSENTAELLKAATMLKDLLKAKIKAEEELKKEESAKKDPQKSDYIEQLQQSIEDSSLSSREKEMLKALSEQLLKAQSLTQLEEVKEVLEQEISSLGQPGASGKEQEILSSVEKNILADLKEKIENLKDLSVEQVQKLQEALKKMQQSQDARQLEEAAQELVKAIKSNVTQDKQEQAQMLEEVQKLKEVLQDLLKKKDASAKDLMKEIDNLENVTVEQVRLLLQEALKKMQQSQDARQLEEAAQELVKAIKSNVTQDKQEQAQMLEEVQKLKEVLQDLLKKKDASAKNLKEKIENLKDLSVEQVQKLQEALKKMQQSQDARQLKEAAGELREAIKSNAVQDRQKQAQMLEEVNKLEEVMDALLEKKTPTAAELKEINKINEKIEQAAQIKQQFLMSQALAEILEKIENLSQSDAKKAQELKEKLEQMRKSDSSEEVEKLILELKNILDTQSDKEQDTKLGQESQQWKVHILSPPLIVSWGITVPLKIIAVYKNGYIKELTSDVEWFSTNQEVAWVDNLNFLHTLAAGKVEIRVVYKGVSSAEAEINVIDGLNVQTVSMIKQELAQQ